MREADQTKRCADAGSRTEADGSLQMFERDFELACINSQIPAEVPAARVTRIQRQSAVDQSYHGADVLAEEAQREGGICYDDRVVPGHFQRSPRKRGAFEAVTLAIFDGAAAQ